MCNKKREEFRQIKGTCGFFALVYATYELLFPAEFKSGVLDEFRIDEMYSMVEYLINDAFEKDKSNVGEIFNINLFEYYFEKIKEKNCGLNLSNIRLTIEEFNGKFPESDKEVYIVPIQFYSCPSNIKKYEQFHYIVLHRNKNKDRYWEGNRGEHFLHNNKETEYLHRILKKSLCEHFLKNKKGNKYPCGKREIYEWNQKVQTEFEWASYFESEKEIDNCYLEKRGLEKRKVLYDIIMKRINDKSELFKKGKLLDDKVYAKGRCVKMTINDSDT